MIRIAAPVLSSAEAARRAGRHSLPCWLVSPGDHDVTIEREFVACNPLRVVRGSSVADLQDAWTQARADWQGRDSEAEPGVPAGIGWLAYDLGRTFEPSLGLARSISGWPDIEFRFYDALWVKDAATGTAQIWAQNPAAAVRLADALGAGDVPTPAVPPSGMGPLAPEEPPERHVAAVGRVLEYLRAGDVYQVNLARRLAAKSSSPSPDAPGWALFARLQVEAHLHGRTEVRQVDVIAVVAEQPLLALDFGVNF